MKNKAIVKNYDSKSQPSIKAIVIYWDDSNKRKRKYFKVRAEAERYATALNLQIEKYGKQARNLSEVDTQDLILAKRDLKKYNIKFSEVIRNFIEGTEKLKPYNANINDAIKHFIEWNDKKKQSTTLNKALIEYLEALTSEGKGERRISSQSHRLKRFMEHFKPSCVVAMITAPQIETWIKNLKTMEYVKKENGFHIRKETKKNISPQTKNDYRLALSAFFNFCYRKDYIKENPINKVVSILAKKKTPKIYTVKEMTEMLNCSKELSEVRLFLALGAFAGLRVAELHRLTWGKIHLDEKIIEVDADITKTNQRRIVEISDNLFEWLKAYISYTVKKDALIIENKNIFRRALEKFKNEYNITWINNGLRHSSASYHLAQSGNANLTAERMGHSVTMLKKHYMGLVRPTEAKKYWNIYPKGNAEIINMDKLLKKAIA